MAVLCLASDIKDLKERLSKIIIGYTYGKVSEQKPVTAGDLHAEGAMTALLKDALKPNLVQTLEHVPAIVDVYKRQSHIPHEAQILRAYDILFCSSL